MDAREQQAEIARVLEASIRLALADPSDNWLDAPMRRASVLAARAYRDLFDKDMPRSIRKALVDEVREALGAANRQREDKDAQAATLASGLAAHIATRTLHAGAARGSRKRWHSLDDDKVRPSHREADGAEVPLSKPFTVGGHKMSGPHDVSAPVEEWIECRCWMEIVPEEAADSLVAAADPDLHAFVIVALPAADDPIMAVSSEQPPHVTMLYLSADYLEQATQILAGLAPTNEPDTLAVESLGELGDEGAQVAFLAPGNLADMRDDLLTYEPIRQAFDALADEQFPEWTPHLTLGYPDVPPLSETVPTTIMIDRLAILHDGLHSEYALGEPMDEDQPTEAPLEVEVTGEPLATTSEVYGYDEVPLYGVLAPEGIATGDGRLFLPDSLTWTEPPMTLRWQEFDDEGHKGSAATARADRIWREPGPTPGTNLIKFEGVASMSDHADKMVGLIAEKVLGGISVDLDDAQVEFRNRDGSEIELVEYEEPIVETDPQTGEEIQIIGEVPFEDTVQAVASGRIRSAAACAIPAFVEAFIAIGTWADHETPAPEGEAEVPEEVTPEQIVASAATILAFAPGTEDGPGWLTHPVDTDRLRDYWVRGEGAAKIGWGAPGDFNRCRTLLAPYVKPQHLAGYCANRHKDALGIWPGEHTGRSLAASAAREEHRPTAPMFTLIASGNESYPDPPAEWFDDPRLVGPSPVVVGPLDPEYGLHRVYGHLTDFTTCHTAYAECTLAPHSPSGYAYFLTGAVLTLEGESIAVGQLTVGTGHADEYANARKAAAHYDHTGFAVADVSAGEDDYGVWVAGYIRPWASDRQIKELRASSLSGDWRTVNGQLDLVAALGVNSPGFPMPRVGLAASGAMASGMEQRVSLVAAGVVPNIVPDEPRSIEQIVAQAVKAHHDVAAVRDAAIAHRRERFAAIKSQIGDR